MIPPSCLLRHIGANGGEVMYIWSLALGVCWVLLNCDDNCMCVVNKKFELFEFVLKSVYVNLKYNEIYLTFTAGSVCLCGICSQSRGRTWSVCEVVLVLYVVSAVTDACAVVCVGCEYAERVRV